VALATANYTTSNWDASACAYEPKRNALSDFSVVMIIAIAVIGFTVFIFRLAAIIDGSIREDLLEELWLTPSEELHEELQRKFTKTASGKKKQASENKYYWRYKFVTFEVDADSQTKIVTLREDMRKIPRPDRVWKQKNLSKAREVQHHTHPAPPRAAFDPAPAIEIPIAIPMQVAAPAPAIGTALTTPVQAFLPALDPDLDRFSFPCNQNDNTLRRSLETVSTNAEDIPRYGGLAVPPPSYNSHGFANQP
jgi:hypothetical protein